MDMPELKCQKKISFIARKGTNIRDRLNEDFKIPAENKLVFFYAGNHGVGDISSGLVGKIKGHTFISFYPLNSSPDNFICLENDIYAHQDIVASSDYALIKPGYGMVSEAMVNNIPIIYPPREDFAEYFAFVQEFENSGGVLLINREDFIVGNWQEALTSMNDIKYKNNYSSTGAIECARIIESLLS
jgi:L-arabinokinase